MSSTEKSEKKAKLDKEGRPRMPLSYTVRHYLDTSSWAGTVVTIVFWAGVVALFYFLVIH